MQRMVDTYSVLVRYRTRSGCNAKEFSIDVAQGAAPEAAMQIAEARMRQRKTTVRIDGSEARLIGTYQITRY